MKNKISVAVDSLNQGQFITIGNIRLGVTEANDIEVAGWSQFGDINNITKSIAVKELNDVKSEFLEMLNSSSELQKFLQGKVIEYRLYFDDYGKVSISICSEKNNVLKWESSIFKDK